MHISLSKDGSLFVERLVASGEFASADEAVAEALRLLRREREVEAALAEGARDFDEGRYRDGEEVFRDLKRRAVERIEREAT